MIIKKFLNVKVKKLHPDAVIPTYATDGSACFDLYALRNGVVECEHSKSFDTGLSFQMPEGHVMLIYSRSGHGFNHGVRLSNCTAVIDHDFRGSVVVKLHNDSFDDFFVKKGQRIAQAMIIPVNQVKFELVEELSVTDRGEGGFGSTGL